MNGLLIWQLAIRYMRGKRSANAAPLLSRISMIAIAVSCAAMIVVLSVFNGLESVVKGLYTSFYPEIRVTTARGKFFKMDTTLLNSIKRIDGVNNITTVIEDNVFVIHHEQQKVITVKGINNDFFKVNNIQDSIRGDDTVSAGAVYTAILGRNILNELGTDTNPLNYIMLYYPNPAVTNPGADPLSAFQTLKVHPAGTFHISDEFDNTYILASLPLVQQLFHEENAFSSVEINADPKKVESIKMQMHALLGSSFRIESRNEQNKTLYMAMNAEKWAIYAILVMVLLIASFNMVGALSMLVLEKQKDIAILRTMGALPATIRAIFLLEGMLWSLTGGLTGIALAVALCVAQQKLGLIRIAGNTIIEDFYPVELQASDFMLVITIVLTVGLLASWYPSIRATKTIDPTLKSA